MVAGEVWILELDGKIDEAVDNRERIGIRFYRVDGERRDKIVERLRFSNRRIDKFFYGFWMEFITSSNISNVFSYIFDDSLQLIFVDAFFTSCQIWFNILNFLQMKNWRATIIWFR